MIPDHLVGLGHSASCSSRSCHCTVRVSPATRKTRSSSMTHSARENRRRRPSPPGSKKIQPLVKASHLAGRRGYRLSSSTTSGTSSISSSNLQSGRQSANWRLPSRIAAPNGAQPDLRFWPLTICCSLQVKPYSTSGLARYPSRAMMSYFSGLCFSSWKRSGLPSSSTSSTRSLR